MEDIGRMRGLAEGIGENGKLCGENWRSAEHGRLTFVVDELLEDIASAAHMESENVEERGERVADVLDNEEWVTRKLDASYAKVLGMLQAYVVEIGRSLPPHLRERDSASVDDKLVDKDSYVIALCMPKAFPMAGFAQLETLVHEYMTASVMGEWMAMTNAERASYWITKADELEERIGEVKNMRRGVMTRRNSWV